MSDTTETEAVLRNAQQVAEAAKTMDDRGQVGKAEAYQRRAEKLYEAAGLDPAWNDRDELVDNLRPTPKPLNPRLLTDGKIEFTDNTEPEAPITGIVADRDLLVGVRD